MVRHKHEPELRPRYRLKLHRRRGTQFHRGRADQRSAYRCDWKDEKAELEREHKREIASWRQANITLALLRGIPVGEWEGTELTDPNGESPTSSPLRKKNGHGGDRVSDKWKAKKAAEVLALSSCSPKRKKKE